MFTLPTFNLTANIWRFGNPTSNPPDVVSPVNLCRGYRTSQTIVRVATGNVGRGGMWLLLPAGTDIRDTKDPAGADTVECPAGSGRMYIVTWVDDAGAGFANEHRFAALADLAPWPLPFPAPGAVAPPFSFVNQFGSFYNGANPAVFGFTTNGFRCEVWYAVVVPFGTAPTLASAQFGPQAVALAAVSPNIGGFQIVIGFLEYIPVGPADVLTFNTTGATCPTGIFVNFAPLPAAARGGVAQVGNATPWATPPSVFPTLNNGLGCGLLCTWNQVGYPLTLVNNPWFQKTTGPQIIVDPNGVGYDVFDLLSLTLPPGNYAITGNTDAFSGPNFVVAGTVVTF